jgi:hypothetical protein
MPICSGCRANLPAPAFYKNKTRKSGLQSKCKDCANKFARHWQSTHPEQFAAKQTIWKQVNPDSTRRSHAKWSKTNQAHLRQYNRDRYQENSKQIQAREKIYMKKQQETLSDVWIRISLARKVAGLKPRDIPRGLIELKRVQLLIARELRAKNPRKQDAYVCKGCGTTFKPKHYRPDGEGTHYCSRECFFSHRRGRATTIS